MKISVVVTVKNDREGEEKLQGALAQQTRKPDEIIIIRASPAVRSPFLPPRRDEHGVPSTTGSTGHSATAGFGRTNEFFQNKNSGPSERAMKNQNIVFAGEDCSRGKGRNIGIRKAKNDVIAVTDVGCTPHRDWLERLVQPLQRRPKGSDLPARSDPSNPAIVIAGFYRVIAKTPFQEAVGPYVAVFPDQRSRRYLPASRSIAFTKRAWELVGGYPEDAKSGAEDLVFAARLVKHPEITMLHAPYALVDWEPPATVLAFFRDMVKHTRGNLETRYWRHLLKNYSVVFRWLVLFSVPWFIPFYLTWPVVKHRRRVGWRSFLFLPVVQIIADAAVIYALLR